METDLSTLRLVFEKGPRKGEALEFASKPRLTIPIGRIVKGNKVTIKDNGISSKHLSINWHSQKKWVVRDLDSSNGTFLNSLQLQPLTDYDIRDGDELKFGEVTSIRVRFSNVSDFHTDRQTRAGARVLETEKPDGGEKVAEEASRRGRGRGRGRGKGAAGSRNQGFATESTDAIASVDLEANMGENLSRRTRSRHGNDDGSSGLEVSALVASVDTQCNMESNAPEQGTRRGRGRQKSENSKTSTVSLVKEEMLKTAENVKGTGQERGQACGSKTRIIQNVKGEAEFVDERSEKGTDEGCKGEPEVSLRRSTRTRRTRKQANAVLPPVLERIPEAPQSADSMSCEEVVVGVPLSKKPNAGTRRGRKKNNEKGAEKELNEGELFSSEPVDGVQTDDCLASDLVHEQEKSKSSEIHVVKSEPQSSVREIVSGGDQPRRELTTDILQNNENLVSELNHEDLEPNSSRDESRGQPSNESTSGIVQKKGDLVCELNPEESERNVNPDDKEEPGSSIGRNSSLDPTADDHIIEKDVVVPDIARDLEKMTLGDWFDYVEKFLPKQIRAETDQIIEDMRKTSQQFHKFMLQQQK